MIDMRKRDAADVPVPTTGRVNAFVDDAGKWRAKLPDGSAVAMVGDGEDAAQALENSIDALTAAGDASQQAAYAQQAAANAATAAATALAKADDALAAAEGAGGASVLVRSFANVLSIAGNDNLDVGGDYTVGGTFVASAPIVVSGLRLRNAFDVQNSCDIWCVKNNKRGSINSSVVGAGTVAPMSWGNLYFDEPIEIAAGDVGVIYTFGFREAGGRRVYCTIPWVNSCPMPFEVGDGLVLLAMANYWNGSGPHATNTMFTLGNGGLWPIDLIFERA